MPGLKDKTRPTLKKKTPARAEEQDPAYDGVGRVLVLGPAEINLFASSQSRTTNAAPRAA
jgi:hypothetical protein